MLLDKEHRLLLGDLILAEVLQGTRDDRRLEVALMRLAAFDAIMIGGHRIAIEAARHYQHLRSLGITIRRTIDTLIAARCIHDELLLLYADRDFDPFVRHLGLRSALDDLGVN
jgi:predicted nucleic acid-binding protein